MWNGSPLWLKSKMWINNIEHYSDSVHLRSWDWERFLDTQFYYETGTFSEVCDRKEEQDAYGCSQFSSWDRKTPRGKPSNAEQPPKCHPRPRPRGRKERLREEEAAAKGKKQTIQVRDTSPLLLEVQPPYLVGNCSPLLLLLHRR